MKRSARWIVVLAAIPLLLSIGASTASALGVYNSEPTHEQPSSMQPFSDPNWKPEGGHGYSVKSMQPFSDLNWKPSVTTEPAQPEPIGGGTNVPAVALIAGLAALAAGIGAFAATLRLKRVRIPSGA
jgi:hypothetical protein